MKKITSQQLFTINYIFRGHDKSRCHCVKAEYPRYTIPTKEHASSHSQRLHHRLYTLYLLALDSL